MTLDKLLEDQPNSDPRDWSKASLAVIANTPHKHGVVLWYVGAHVETAIELVGAHDIDELGFEDAAPIGISVWEGRTVGGDYNSQGDYDDCYLRGTYRAPTDEEWAAIRAGRCPWDEYDWYREGYKPSDMCTDCGTLGPHHCSGVPGGFSDDEAPE